MPLEVPLALLLLVLLSFITLQMKRGSTPGIAPLVSPLNTFYDVFSWTSLHRESRLIADFPSIMFMTTLA